MTSIISIFSNAYATLTCDMTARNASGERVLIWFHARRRISALSRTFTVSVGVKQVWGQRKECFIVTPDMTQMESNRTRLEGREKRGERWRARGRNKDAQERAREDLWEISVHNEILPGGPCNPRPFTLTSLFKQHKAFISSQVAA